MTSKLLPAIFGTVAVVAATLAYATISRPYLAQRWHDQWFGADGANEFQDTMRGTLVQLDRQLGPGRVFLLGDSRVQQLDVSAIDPRAVNFGIGFDTVDGLKQRVPDYHALSNAAAAIIAVGINDIGKHPPQEVGARIESLLGRLPPGVPVVLSAVLPVDEAAEHKIKNGEVRSVDNLLIRYCEHRPQCRFAPVPPALLDSTGGLRAQAHSGDGVHLTADADLIWAATLRHALAEVARPVD